MNMLLFKKVNLIRPTFCAPLFFRQDRQSNLSFFPVSYFRIFVNMDDNIIEHYTNQSAFLIEMSEVVSGQIQVTLVEVWEQVSCLLDWRMKKNKNKSQMPI